MLRKACERMRHQLIALPAFGVSTSHIQHVQVCVCVCVCARACVSVSGPHDPFTSERGGRTHGAMASPPWAMLGHRGAARAHSEYAEPLRCNVEQAEILGHTAAAREQAGSLLQSVQAKGFKV